MESISFEFTETIVKESRRAPVSEQEVASLRLPQTAAPLSDEAYRQALDENRWKALIIGISEYPKLHAGGLSSSLGGTPVADCRSLSTLLSEEYGFDCVELYDGEATRRGITEAIDVLARQCQPSDNVLVYYAGHGERTESGMGVWLPADAEDLYDGLASSLIADYAKNLRARRVLLISDSCFAGVFLETRDIPDYLLGTRIDSTGAESEAESERLVKSRRTARVSIGSGADTPVANEGTGPSSGKSPFAYALISTLESVPTGAAMSARELFAEVRESLPENQTGQVPVFSRLEGDGNGEFVFVRRRR